MFRFTIRELVLLSIVIALALGWGLDHTRIEATMAKAAMLRDALQSTLYDYEQQTGNCLSIQLPDGEFIQSRKPTGILLGGRG